MARTARDWTAGRKARLSRARPDGNSDDAAPAQRRPRRHGLESLARQGRRTGRGRCGTRRHAARGRRERRHYLHVPPRCSRRGASGVRSRRPGKRRRRRQTRGRLLLDPSRCGALDRGAAEGGERHGLDRRAGLRRHQGRRGRHARGHGRRRCRRYRAGAALCAGDGAPVHAYGADQARARPQSSATRSSPAAAWQ